MTETSKAAVRRRLVRTLNEHLRQRPRYDEVLKRGIAHPRATVWRWTEQDSLATKTCWTPISTEVISQYIGGLHFSIEITLEGDVIACGMPESLSFESFQTRSRSKSLCHSPTVSTRRVRRADQQTTVRHSAFDLFPVRSSLLLGQKLSIRSVACGVGHCLVLAKHDTDVLQTYAWGIGHYGQLGLGNSVATATVMTPIETLTGLFSERQSTVDNHGSVHLRCGPFSSCVVVTGAKGSNVWLWGLVPTVENSQATCIFEPSNDVISCPFKIHDVCLGLTHVVFLSDTGEVYTWGHNDVGQLGRGLGTNQDGQLHRIEFHNRSICIASITCGYDHTLAITSDGLRVFAWGSNRMGACGATTKFYEYPHPVEILNTTNTPDRVVRISCAGHTSVAVVEDTESHVGRVMVWGVSGSQHAQLRPVIVEQRSSEGISAGYGEIHGMIEDGFPFPALNNDESRLEKKKFAPINEPVIVLAMSMSTADNTRLRDLHWRRPLVYRVRVLTSDVLVLLLDVSTPSLGVVRLSNANCLVNVRRLPQPTRLYLVVVKCETVGAFDVILTPPESDNELILLSVDCCASPTVRRDLLLERRSWIQQCFEATLQSNDDGEWFQDFITRVCEDQDICRAIKYSPLALPFVLDQDQQLGWDLDQCTLELAARLARFVHCAPSLPRAFALWMDSLMTNDDNEDDTIEVDSAPVEGITLQELIHSRSSTREELIELEYLAIANLSVMPMRTEANGENRNQTTANTRSKRTTTHPASFAVGHSLCVPQVAFDFVVDGSQLKHTSAMTTCTEESTAVGIRRWWNERGDLFYSSTTSTDSIIQIIVPSREEDTVRSTAVRRLQRHIHELFWFIMDTNQFSTRTLYSTLGLLSNATQLQRHVQTMGFSVGSMPEQTWYSLFTTLQHLVNDQDEGGISLHALRVFCVDPYHADFWRAYLVDWRDAVAQCDVCIEDILAQAFSVPSQPWVEWSVFATGVRCLHEQLHWPLNDRDLCRLLYRFDAKGDGTIAFQHFLECLVHALPVGIPPWRFDPLDRGCLGRSRLKKPNVESFSTINAVRKLYQSRSIDHHSKSIQSYSDEVDDLTRQLCRLGNSRLARIRNLPVSRLLSEGVHFHARPTHRQRQQYGVSDSSTTKRDSVK